MGRFYKSLLTLVVFGMLLGAIGGFLSSTAEARLLVKLPPATGGLGGLAVRADGWRYLPEVGMYVVESADDPRLRELQEEGGVEFAAPEAAVEMAHSPNDPYFANQESTYGENGISVLPVWDQEVGNAGVVVAVIDTGMELTHPDLVGNLWTNGGEIPGNGVDDDHNGYVDDLHGYDFAAGDDDPTDENGHGTHLAGVIGAVGDNGIGVAGINWKVQMMPLKFTDADGKGSTVLAVEAIDYAIRNGAEVINASWNVKMDETDRSSLEPLRAAIERASDAGILFVTAAGNHSEGGRNTDLEPVYPADLALPNMVSVASVDAWGNLASFSNYGTGIDVAAPGVAILSTIPGGSYGMMSGTSVSTAFATGSAAMLLSVNRSLSPVEMKEALLSGSTHLDTLNGLLKTSGKLTLSNAVQRVGGSVSPTSASTSVIENPMTPPSGGCSLIP